MNALLRIFQAAAAACFVAPIFAWSQVWPEKPIRVVFPYPPGATEVPMRLLAPKMQETLGQPLMLEHRPGANGTIGAQLVAKSAPDGYTILYTNSNPLVFAPATQKYVPYDPVRDFTPITTVLEGISVLVANPLFPANSVKELIQYAKANAGKLFYGSSGVGGAQHIDGQNFNRLAGTNIIAVQFQGFAKIVPAVLSGQVPIAYLTLSAVKPLVASGKLKIIASAEASRLAMMPGIETIAETLPGFEKAAGWTALLAPARLPQPILERLYAAAVKGLSSPEIQARFAEEGSRMFASTPEQFAAKLKAQIETTARRVKVLGIDLAE